VLRHVGFAFNLFEGEPTLYRPVGCEDCHGGYLGRLGVYEVMPTTDEVEALVLSRSSADEIPRRGKGGMVRMRADGLLKAARGTTDRGDTAPHRVSAHAKPFCQKFNRKSVDRDASLR
jgi:type IV pilus assembly protein PilB